MNFTTDPNVEKLLSGDGIRLRFDNVGIAVRDIRKMYRFYTKVLGMQASPLSEEATKFGGWLGGVAFFVFQTSDTRSQGRSVIHFQANPPGYDHLVFVVDDIEAASAYLVAKGVEFESTEDLILPGELRKYRRFKDPEGNLLGIFQRVTR